MYCYWVSLFVVNYHYIIVLYVSGWGLEMFVFGCNHFNMHALCFACSFRFFVIFFFVLRFPEKMGYYIWYFLSCFIWWNFSFFVYYRFLLRISLIDYYIFSLHDWIWLKVVLWFKKIGSLCHTLAGVPTQLFIFPFWCYYYLTQLCSG